MMKDVKTTYSRKKLGVNNVNETAFDEARKIDRRKRPKPTFPNGVPYALSPKSKIWCKISPHSPRKEVTKSPEVKAKGRKRKLQYVNDDQSTPVKRPNDPFGFNDLEDDIDVLVLDTRIDEESPIKGKKSPSRKKTEAATKKKSKKTDTLTKKKPVKDAGRKNNKSSVVKVGKKSPATPKSKGLAAQNIKKEKSKTPTRPAKKLKLNKENAKGKAGTRPKKTPIARRESKKSKPKAAKKATNEVPLNEPTDHKPPQEGTPDPEIKEEKPESFDFPDEPIDTKEDRTYDDSSFEKEHLYNDDDGEDPSPPLTIFISRKTIVPARSKGRKSGDIRVNRKEKELFTIVKNTKQAHECSESGESQLFLDDANDLLDGIKPGHSSKMRCLSAIELVTKSGNASFRLSLRAHGYVDRIFAVLQDSVSDPGLGLCTAAIMFMLTRDRQNIAFNKTILDLLLSLLTVKEETGKVKLKELAKVKSSIRNIFLKENIKGVETLDLSNLSASVLAQQSLLSVSSQRTGEWFKDELRILGGLDHIVDTVLELNNFFGTKGNKYDPLANLETVKQIERCLKLLENVTFKSPQNQAFLCSLKDAALMETSLRLLKDCRRWLTPSNENLNRRNHQDCLLTTLRLLLNLTHDNEEGSAKLCNTENALYIILETGLSTTEFVSEDKRFDSLVLSLGLLINLVEHSKQNLSLLNSVQAPLYYECGESKDEFVEDAEDFSTIHALMQLFLVKAEAAKSSSMITENLPDLNTTISCNTTLRLGPDGLSLYCEEKPGEEDAPSEQPIKEPTKKKKADKKNIGEALKKASKHMEDSFVASYGALLLGLLSQEDKGNREIIHRCLPEGNFAIMVETLTEFLNFTTMTSAAEWSGMEAIKQVLSVFKECQKTYQGTI